MLTLPFETLNNKKYLRQCAEILEKSNAIKIAITGSYGKTSVKNILTVMLKEKFRVAVTSESVNTPLGISKYVNGGGTSEAEVIIFEFGARKQGDIDELCHLVKPNMGIITGLAPQHLQTFKTFENVVKTKTELLRYLHDDEFCVINGGDVILSAQKENCEILTAGEGSFVTAQNLQVNCNGSEFDLKFGEIVVSNCQTKLLGRHNITNICLAAACAYRLGVESKKIHSAIGKMMPTPHRLEILPSKTGIIIDDSYNANINGICAAADVLKIFSQTKIVITQGIVEGGKKTKELNVDAGKILGEVVDKAVVTGKNAKYLAQGLLQGGLDKEDILFAPSVTDGVNLIKNELSESVLLFQNDLPL